MGSHPLNLLLRFLLELTAFGAVVFWAWSRFAGVVRWAGVILAPAMLMACWGVFAVPDDPSRGGAPVVAVSGPIRFALEIGVFGVAIWALNDVGYRAPAAAMTLLVVAHYALSWDRIVWLWSRR